MLRSEKLLSNLRKKLEVDFCKIDNINGTVCVGRQDW